MNRENKLGTPPCGVKTAFVVFRTLEFNNSVGDIYSFDRSNNARLLSEAPLKVSVQRNLWSYTVEAILEYCRICFDLFSSSNPISVIAVDSEEKILSVWYQNDQSLEAVWKVLSGEACSTTRLNFDACNPSNMPGLFSCKSVLQLPTPSQTTAPSRIGKNYGRVIVFGTGIHGRISGWIPGLLQQIKQPPQADGYISIDRSEWIFVDLDSSLPPDTKLKEEVLTSSGVHLVSYLRVPISSRSAYLAIMHLAERKLGLASTLVQEIPMKEEANVSSNSSLYGVELIHEAKAHEFLHRLGLANRLYARQPGVENEFQQPPSGLTKTLGINWVTPRSTDSHLIRYSIGAYRVTLTAVGNRASVCLAQFVLGGRCVVLAHKLHDCAREDSAGDGNPLSACHHAHPTGEVLLLLCHGSVMYLHVLAMAAAFTHPPVLPVVSLNFGELSDSVPTFRVPGFVKNFVNPARLAPASANSSYAVPPKVRALQHVERCTRYMPLKLDSTVLGGNALAGPLFEHLPKDFLESSEVAACESAINLILEFIQSHPVLKENVSSLIPTQPVAMALELGHLLKQYADISEDHTILSENFKRKMETVILGTSKRLSRLVSKANSLLANATAPPGSTLAQLMDIGKALPAAPKRPHIPQDQNADSNIVNEASFTITSCAPDIFMQRLFAATTKKKTVSARSEFAGVLLGASLGSKGPLRLYAELEDK